MKSFIYNLLSKGLLLAVLIAVAAGYYYRATLFPKWFGEDAAVVEIAPVPAPETGKTPSAEVTGEDTAATTPVQIPAVSEAAGPMDQPEGGVSKPAPQRADGADMTTATIVPRAEQDAGSGPTTDAAAIVQAPEAAAGSQPQESTPAGDEPVPEEVSQAPDSVAPAAAPEMDAAATLALARQAYWDDDVEGAVSAYQAAIAADPENPDAYGELGNLYFARGDWEGASQAYLDAGLRLIAQGRPEQAAGLLRIIGRLDPLRARQLARALYMARTGEQPPAQ